MTDKKYNEILSNAATESVIKCKKIRELLTPDSEKRDLILPKFDMIEEYSKFIQSSEFIVPSVRIFEALEILFDFPHKLLQNEKLIKLNISMLRKILLGEKYYKSDKISLHHLPMLLFIPNLKSSAFHTHPKIDQAKKILEKNFKIIQKESLNLETGFRDYTQGEYTNIHDGKWQSLKFYDERGNEISQNCKQCPETKKTLDMIENKAFGYIDHFHFFSALEPGTEIYPHFGSHNHKLRIHMGISGCEGTELAVGKETYHWKVGESVCFDDSFNHSVKHRGNKRRIVLITDIYHPELELEEIKFLEKLNSLEIKPSLDSGEL